jgi:alpha-L-fucosidase 2
MSDYLERYHVVWDSPSRAGDVSGSMPIGNGDLGANVWAEDNGDVLLLVGKTDAWDENSINLKLGRIRLRISPTATGPFRQTLRLRTGDIEIVHGGARFMIWADANHPVIRIEAHAEQPFELAASLEMWRTEPRTIKTQTGDLFKRLGAPDPYPTVVSPDRVLRDDDDRVVWCHHNERPEHDGFEINMRLQGLGGMLGEMPHPLLGRTFGAAMEKSGGRATRHRLAIHALTLHPSTVEEWQRELDATVARTNARPPEAARHEHERWWDAFWQRSWIDVPGAFDVTRGCVLQRFMNACGGRGAQPIKFNGSIFTVGKPDDPDFRRWGGPGFWFMNQRLIYWPMLASGDLDLMRPWLRMYLDMLPLQRHRTQKYFAHGGAHYPETITFWGGEVSAHYGWTPFEQRARPEAECSYVTYYWTCGLELTLILWSFYAQTQDDSFAREYLLPIADAVTEFYDLHYPRDADGKIRISPSQALETWQDATNPTPDVAGLADVLTKLLDLPEHLAGEPLRERWSRMLASLPPIPIGRKDGTQVILPAERFDKLKNKENPELYSVFPFRLYGVAKPGLPLARDTFLARLHASHECWSQDDVHAACLGLAEQAKENVARRAAPAKESRFPAFWDAHHDWVPDMDHGGVLQLALQNMLMQCEGRRIVLLPAWPNEWDADFRLHAPQQTVLEGKVRNGWVEELRVTPEKRREDVVIWQQP